MALTDPPLCERCAGDTRYSGRISLPAQIIYRCDACGHEMWVPSNATPQHRPEAQPHEAHQPQQQHQQQPQSDEKKD